MTHVKNGTETALPRFAKKFVISLLMGKTLPFFNINHIIIQGSHRNSQISPYPFGLRFIYGFSRPNILVFVLLISYPLSTVIENDDADLNLNGKRTIQKHFIVNFPKIEVSSKSICNFLRYLPLKTKTRKKRLSPWTALPLLTIEKFE